MRRSRVTAVLTVVALASGLVAVPGSATAAASVSDGCVTSVPEPASVEPVSICYTLYQPASASSAAPAPVIFHSHGWGGSRTTDPAAFGSWVHAGFGVISFDQRGFGESGGQAHVEHPDFEGQDVQRLVDLVATLDWVKLDGPGDPVIGAIGGSYGGGYQYVGALSEVRERGATRFDALAPEITWWDLKESLAPSAVVRTAWVTALYAAGIYAHTDAVHKGFAYGAATGDWPTGQAGIDMDEFFRMTGPKFHAGNGDLLDIPVVIGQGINDNLFNLNQGLKTFAGALTPAAQTRSIFVGYSGGHALPSALPTGAAGSGDPCSAALAGGSFSTLARRFFTEELLGVDTALGGRGAYHLATTANQCLTVAGTEPSSSFPIGSITTATGPAGAPQYVKIADGPLTIAGTPYVDATVTSLGVDNRAFLALATGTTALDARIVQNNMLPLRETGVVADAPRSIELPAAAVSVPAGQSLFLAVSPFSDMSFGHGSRVPGTLTLTAPTVRLPVV